MMRRLLYILGVMATCFATSCSDDITSTEGVYGAEVQDYVDVNISTELGSSYTNDGGVMGACATRADLTAISGFTAVSDDVYDMRYTIELWSSDGSNKIERYEVIATDIAAGLSHSFRTFAGDYKLVIFADYVESDGSGTITSSHYDTDNLNAIAINTVGYTGNDSSRDCYGYCANLKIEASFTLSATLDRVMAMMTLADTNKSIGSGSAISITYSPSIPSGYNLLAGEAITDDSITIAPSYPTTTAADQDIIAYDYIFVDSATSYYMDIDVAGVTRASTIGFEQNKITNITSDFSN